MSSLPKCSFLPQNSHLTLTHQMIDQYIQQYHQIQHSFIDGHICQNNSLYDDSLQTDGEFLTASQQEQKSRLILLLRVKKLTDRVYYLENKNRCLLEQNNKLVNIIEGDILKIHKHHEFKTMVDNKRFRSLEHPNKDEYDLLFSTYNELFLKFDETFHQSKALTSLIRQINFNNANIQGLKPQSCSKDSQYYNCLSDLFTVNIQRMEKEMRHWEDKVLVLKQHIKTISSVANQKIHQIKKSIKQIQQEKRQHEDGSFFQILSQSSEQESDVEDQIFECLHPSNYSIYPQLNGIESLKKHFESFEKRLLFLLNTTTVFE